MASLIDSVAPLPPQSPSVQDVAAIRASLLQELDTVQRLVRAKASYDALRRAVPPKMQEFWNPARYKGAYGGRGSSKSWSFGHLLLDRARQSRGFRAVCIREVQKSLEQSVKRLLEDLIQAHSLPGFKTLSTHIETPGGGVLLFQGMQNHTADSIKSLEGYDVAWVEEAQSLSERSLTLLRPTIRKEGSELWFTWNPDKASDPVDKLLRGENCPPDAIVREVNYHDNPYLPKVLLDELEWDLKRDPDKYSHVWLGGYAAHSSARVFKNWTVDQFETPGSTAFLFGGDWGFSVDPTVLVRGWVDEAARKLFFDREVYRVGCEIVDTPALFDQIDPDRPQMARQWEIIADSARPETISHMQKHGYPRIVAARKGPGSVEEGIQFLKNYDIVVHERCIHLRDELASYSYKVDQRTGQILPVLSDKKNHVIDSARYMTEKLRRATVPSFVVW